MVSSDVAFIHTVGVIIGTYKLAQLCGILLGWLPTLARPGTVFDSFIVLGGIYTRTLNDISTFAHSKSFCVYAASIK